MFGTLRIGLTGLRANQQYLDVIGNNLTNSATIGFKADRITFSDIIYQTSRRASGPNNDIGGVNARQTGFGTQVSSVDRLDRQGNLVATGRTFDLALQGNGYFVVSNGSEDFYSRVGTFGLDREGSLVDTRTGFRVQNLAGSSIDLDPNSVTEAIPTTRVSYAGNLPANVTGPLAEVQATSSPFVETQPAIATSGLAAGSTIDLSGQQLLVTVNGSANQFVVDFGASGTQTLQQVADTIQAAIDAQGFFPSATATLNGAGELIISSGSTGDSATIQVGGTAGTSLQFSNAVVPGTENNATATSLLNDLDSNVVDYVPGDTIRVVGIDAAGTAIDATFVYGTDGTTLGDLVTFIDGIYAGSAVSLNNGTIEIEANQNGESNLSISIQDGQGNTGKSTFGVHGFTTLVEGSGPDQRATSITVVDSLGLTHVLSGLFSRQDDGSWNLDLSIPPEEGNIIGSPITQINFAADGTLALASGTTIDLAYANGAATQSVQIGLGSPGSLNGLTQFGTTSTVNAVEQDGSEPGTLISFGVTQSGVIQGFYSNGVVRDLDTVAVATFQNAAGLSREGATLFRRTDNSGQPLINEAGEAGSGIITAGALEGSNVDTAEEFVRLIEAQRSFQGAARIVTTADEVFVELLQIV